MNTATNQNNEIKKHCTLYVLRLVQGKYYVGITTKTPEERMLEHLQGVRPAVWTQKHKPLEIIERQDLGMLTKSEATVIETRKTEKLMLQYGHNNVRGGDLTYGGSYLMWFHRLIEERDLDALHTVLVLFGIIVLFAILYILKE